MKDEKIKSKEITNSDKYAGLKVMTSLFNRMMWANSIATQSYNGDRNVYTALGYPENLSFEQYLGRYFRQDMAKAVIDRPVKASWKGEIAVIENTKTKQTKFEKSWKKLYNDLKLKSLFIRADKLTGLGSYSILLLGLNDVKTDKGFERKVKKGAKLLYVKPFSEKSASIHKWETNRGNPRYGKPLQYKVVLNSLATTPQSSASNALASQTFQDDFIVHHSRVIHLTEDILEDETFGIPRLQAVFNRLMDLEKLVGGDAEMFWRGARPGYTGLVKDDYEMTSEMAEALQEDIEKFEHNFKRFMVNEGVDIKSLEQQIADPSSHVDIQVQMLSAVTGIPKRILVGSERGELSSAQDKQEWISYVTSRREEQNEPNILRPFIDRLVEYKILPTPKDNEYTVVWDKLFSLSDKEKVELGKNRAIALKEYSTNPGAQYMMPFNMFLEFYSGLDSNQISKIVEYRKEEMERKGEKELSIKEIAELNAAATRQMERTSENDSRTESGSNRKRGIDKQS